MPLAAAAALVVSACGLSQPPRVGVRALTADIVFAAEANPGEAPPANFALGSQPGQFRDFRLSGGFDAQPFQPTAGFTSLSSCPPAARDAFPEVTAPDNVPAPPEEGRWSWRRSSRTKLPAAEFALRSDSTEERVVRNVRRITAVSGIEFNYDVVQPEGKDTVVVTTYKVKTAALTVGVEGYRADDPPGGFIVHPPTVPPGVRPGTGLERVGVGDPERGLSLMKIERLDAKGNSLGAFEPSAGLLLMPLRVVPGEAFQAAAADPRTGQQIAVDARVRDRQNIDACGRLVQGWLVESTQTFTAGQATATREYRYIVVTHLGGLIGLEEIKTADAQGQRETLFHWAEPRPRPLR